MFCGQTTMNLLLPNLSDSDRTATVSGNWGANDHITASAAEPARTPVSGSWHKTSRSLSVGHALRTGVLTRPLGLRAEPVTTLLVLSDDSQHKQPPTFTEHWARARARLGWAHAYVFHLARPLSLPELHAAWRGPETSGGFPKDTQQSQDWDVGSAALEPGSSATTPYRHVLKSLEPRSGISAGPCQRAGMFPGKGSVLSYSP